MPSKILAKIANYFIINNIIVYLLFSLILFIKFFLIS